MTTPADSPEPGRGAQRRQNLHESRRREQALRWLRQPAVLLFLAVLLLAGAGWALLIRATARLPVEEATVGDLNLHLERTTWVVDQMEHGSVKQPASMMPDLPEWGKQRITVDMAFRNLSRETQEYHGEELSIVPEIGEDVPPFGAVVGQAELLPGQTLNTVVHFDVDTTKPHGRLLMKWQRGEKSAYFAIPDPPEHFHLRPRGGDVSLPADANLLLPIADKERGATLYAGVYGCAACHGDPKVPDSNNIGPHLASIGVAAEARIKDTQAAQYIYDSILYPNAFIAPECKGRQPCDNPSSMPEYSTLVNLQDAADLLGYLLEQRATPQAAAGAGIAR